MKGKIRMVICDGSRGNREQLASYVNTQGDIDIVGFAANGEEALKLILTQKPDIAVLEVLLPEKDGLGVLEELRQRNFTETACIMVSTMDSDSIISRALELGAKYYLVKPLQSAIFLRRVRQIYEGRQEIETVEKRPEHTVANIMGSAELRVSRLLNRLGITASIKGYHYVRSAILMAWSDPEMLIGITKGLYPDIAKQYKTSASKVERAIRHAIESAWRRGGGTVYNELIGYHPGSKPTNGQFIAAVSEYIRMYPDEKTA